MTDLNERMRGIDRLTPPDLWEAAQVKGEGGLTSPSPPSLTRRLAIIAAALALGLAAVGLVVIAFRSAPSTTRPVTPARSAVQNGEIWVKVGGGDGETTIYRVDPPPGRNVEAMWTDSGGTFAGTPVAPSLIADDYAFSPDGSQVAFSSQEGQGSGEVPRELFVMNADGTGLRQLTNDRAYAGFPDWSPDGDTIAYASYRGTNYVPGCLGFSICPTDLYVIDATGGTPSLLAAGDTSETTPSWSPDGSSVAFAEIGEDGVGAIVTARTNGSGRVQVAPTGAVSFPSWSPDGTQILFLKVQDGTNHLWTVNPDGSGRHDLADTRTDTNFGRPLWSPEGDYIAFARPYAGVVSLWIIDPAGDRSPERIAGWPGFDGSPIAWRPIPVAESSSPIPTEGPDVTQSVRVPNLEGLTLNEAQEVLVRVGLEEAPIYLASEAEPVGHVSSMEPEPGTRVEAGTSVIVYLSAGPGGGGFVWSGTIVKANPDVFLGSYRGANNFPVLAIGPDVEAETWQAELEQRAGSRPFELVQCPVSPMRLREVATELLTLVEGGGIKGVASFGVDPRTCSVLVEGSFSAQSIRLLEDRFGDLATIIDGIEAAKAL